MRKGITQKTILWICLMLSFCISMAMSVYAADIPLTEGNVPDANFRKYFTDNFTVRMEDGVAVIDSDEVTSISLVSENAVSDLKGIELFTELTHLYLDGPMDIPVIDLSGNDNIEYVSLNNMLVYAVNLSSEFNGQISASNWTVEAAAKQTGNGTYVLPIPEGVNPDRMFDVSEEIVDGNFVWENEEDIPQKITYNYMVAEDYVPDYSGRFSYSCWKDYIDITIPLSNNKQILPAGVVVELTEDKFPDENFRKYLASYNSRKKSNFINTEEFESLTLDGNVATKIRSLEGIEYLTNLQYLDVNYLPITSLDLSNNKYLTTVYIWGSTLTDLDITGCTDLENLTMDNVALSELDFSNNKKLRRLTCRGGTLTDVDLSGCSCLRYLDLSDNALKNLKYSSGNIRYLNVSSGNNRLTKLDITKLNKIETLEFYGNKISDYGTAAGFNTDNMPNLVELWIDDQNGNITELDISNNKEIRFLDIDNNSQNEMFYLKADFPSLKKIMRITLHNVMLTNNEEEVDLDLSNLENLTWVDYENQDFATFKIKNMDTSNCFRLDALTVRNLGIESIKTDGDTALTVLDCPGNNLKELDISKIRSLQSLYCQNNNLQNIDTSNNKALKNIECDNNPIRGLDFSNNKGVLETLGCSNGSLTSLDISENSGLKEMNVSNQVLTLSENEVEDLSAGEPEVLTSNLILKTPENGGKLINLAKYGKFDPKKVSELSAGELTDKGILFKDGVLPTKLTYKYEVKNKYKLSDAADMNVTISFKDIIDNNDPVTNPDENTDPTQDPDDNNDPTTNPDDNNNSTQNPNNNGEKGSSGTVSGSNLVVDVKDPFNVVHDNDGSDAVQGTVSGGNAAWIFDPVKSNTVVVVKQVDISQKFKGIPGFNSSAKCRYIVDKKGFAKVNKKGVLKPKKRGDINIQLEQKVSGGSWTKVGNPVHLYIQMPEMQKEDSLTTGDLTIDAFKYLSHTTYRPNSWKSTNSSVASIDSKGVITIHKKGKTNIIAIYGDGKNSSKKMYKTKLKIS